ncbi:LLM class F420-dependent oxidoreductase [Mycolicibacterium conceptionense]|uniref:TIGR03619 family F420-dependent LLM class oxidoreductase n=1 Tax=Mycolicibacterium conceptionense TaxID=451644 RepID=UPI0007EC33ED|nr:TIGR03619 family F420-dependent LLM class oxidoreductase [Mycolicibacterium conceptionense]OBJ96876.1 LLM class F420-dependent oxidoreductase [Mycolicibacterium conceptionense]OMB80075.1 LLM class F420-dependent oxidoreductase [Mycolicibacterium conceptionense]OMB82565.1 LLM class F420-dependent oxidoreductase [Mycolicibacterium conceptionense]
MRLGLRLPQRLGVDLQHDLVEAARTAEDAGYASLWTYERLLFPESPVESYAGTDVAWPRHSRQAADPLAVLTAAAVVTEKVRLGTSVLVAALHTPIQLAKAIATIDQISGGRMVAGLGTGWATDELQATGATRADRGRFLNETLDVFDAAWGPDPVTFKGPRVTIDHASVLPKPVSKIPVLLGGGGSNLGRGTSSKALQRIAKRADGWMPVLTTPGLVGVAELRTGWNRIREMASEYGRDASRMEMVVVGNVTFTERDAGPDRSAFVGTLDQIMEDIDTAAQAGADELIVDLNLQDWFTSTGQMLETAVEIRQRYAV